MNSNLSPRPAVNFGPRGNVTASREFRAIAFILLHIPLGFILDLSGWIGALHALLILAYGLRSALREDQRAMISILGYLAGVEILWRMTDARIFWEYGKYASILLVVMSLLLISRPSLDPLKKRTAKINPALVFYFAFLLPSTVLTLSLLEFGEARDELSFNLSGPLSLTFLGIYFWRRKLARPEAANLLVAIVAPITGIWARSAWSTVSAATLQFSQSANFITSAGFGPNQVSNILGLGTLLCILMIVIFWSKSSLRLFFSGLAAVFFLQAILTFSRGGVYSLIIASAILGFHLVRTAQNTRRFLALVIFGSLFAWGVGVPLLNRITASIWQDRFTDLNTTGRLEIATADLQLFLKHPIAGVGVGLARDLRQLEVFGEAPSHTELSRLLAEHGAMGIISLLILIALFAVNYFKAKKGTDRAFVATFAAWSISIMAHSGMRIVAISLCLALSFAAWSVSSESERD